jgi:plastocyanin
MTTPIANSAKTAFMAAIVAMALAFGLTVPAWSAGEKASARAAVTHTVEIRDLAFVPAILRVQPGDQITWINRDIAPHTVTAADESWDSGEMAQGDTYTQTVKADQTGNYFCGFHPSMTARLDIRRN